MEGPPGPEGPTVSESISVTLNLSFLNIVFTISTVD